MNLAISVRNLAKTYKGNTVVNNLNFQLEKGRILGLLGPNGAGKTTTLKMLTNLIPRSSGSVLIDGISLDEHPKQALQLVGASLDTPAFYNEFTALENLNYIATLHENMSKEKVIELIELVGLSQETTKKVKHYSLGMKQRLALARALIHDPKLVILDEPANGLDPQGMHKLYQLIRSLATKQQVSFIISSHHLSDMEQLCTDVLIINKGKTIIHGKTTELMESSEQLIEVTFQDQNEGMEYLKTLTEIEIIHHTETNVLVKINDLSFDSFLRRLVENNLVIQSIYIKIKSLEELFIELTDGWD